MSDPAPGPGRGSPLVRVAIPLLVVAALGAAIAWWLRPPPAPPMPPMTTKAPAAPAEAPSEAPSTPTPAPVHPTPKPVRPAETPAPAPSAPAPSPKAMLHVSSDVAGAFVFVDRQFIGKTPLDPAEVSPGHHQVKVSAEGYDGYSESVDIGETGTTELNVSLKAVRLDASVAVVHKHAIGSCEGTLRADPNGLRFETTNASDAFTMPFGDLEIFTVDYQQKTLKVKKRGGRTWNFTTKAANADPLLSFQQQVQHAIEKLAAGK